MSNGDRDNPGSDTQVRVAKITAFQAIAVALITAAGGGIGYFAASSGSGAEPPPVAQRWLVIDGVDGPVDEAVRIVATVNGIIYAYPADVPFTRIGINMPSQRLPLPAGADSYTVSFEAQFRAEGSGEAPSARSRERPQFPAGSLPRDTQEYSLHAVIGGEKQAEVALRVLYSFR